MVNGGNKTKSKPLALNNTIMNNKNTIEADWEQIQSSEQWLDKLESIAGNNVEKHGDSGTYFWYILIIWVLQRIRVVHAVKPSVGIYSLEYMGKVYVVSWVRSTIQKNMYSGQMDTRRAESVRHTNYVGKWGQHIILVKNYGWAIDPRVQYRLTM
jgi:hypothetical protein